MKVKKLLCLALAAALTCPGLPAQAAQTQATSTAAQSEHAISPANALETKNKFQIDENGCLVIPDGVTTIAEYQFENCSELTSVSIPKSVTVIGDYAFYGCTNLENISIPNDITLTWIGQKAFHGTKWHKEHPFLILNHTLYSADPESCTGNIAIPEGVTSIDDFVFSDCTNLTSVTLPEGLTSIGDCAFLRCTNLTSVTLPEGLASIGSHAFSDCTSLTSVTLPEGLTSIGSSAFFRCTNLGSVSVPESIVTLGDYAFDETKWKKESPMLIISHILVSVNPESCAGIVTIPDGITSIGTSAFSGCTNLTSINIPEGVTSIGAGAFSGCSNLEEISIPDSATMIELGAFHGTKWHKEHPFLILGNNLISVEPEYCNGDITIPDGVTRIENYVFYQCTSLTNIIIPNSVTTIGGYAFYGCTSLTSISIPGSVSTIGDCAFLHCSNLTDLTISEGVTQIGDSAFDGTSLTSISIPKSVRSIGYEAIGFFMDEQNDIAPKPGFLIRGYAGTAAETYAKENGFEFLELQEETPAPPAEVTPTPIVQPTPPAEVTPTPPAEVTPTPPAEVTPTPIVQPTPPTEVTPTPPVEPTPPAEVTPTPPVEPTPPAEVAPTPEPEKADIANATVALPQSAYTYTGKPLSPPITVTYGGKALSLGKDYAAVYTDNINAGTAKVTLTGAGGYQGSITKTFTISKAGQPISGTKSYQKPYGGKPFLLDAARTAGDGALSYSSSAPKVASVSQKGKITIKGTGAATITVTAKETANYAPQTFQVEVRVSPKKPTLSTLKPKGGRRLAISWKKDMRATGYEVWCSTSKSFKKGLKKAKIKGNKVTSCQFSKLKAGKKYYVRLRSYKTVKANGKTIVLRSKWSSVKQSKKIKR